MQEPVGLAASALPTIYEGDGGQDWGFFTVRRRRCQESCRNLAALRRLLASLYPHWQVIISYVSEGSGGNGERLAFLYDSTRFQPSGLVGENVLPPIGE